ncbi:hypothetical protein A6S26_27500 [Nostoc sp. ATCC 43529]|nr:hypothetical protein A6S26_27500 [Nostoc sp. ATCC 43529]
MTEDPLEENSQEYLNFQQQFKSVVVDGIKYYVFEGDILLDDNEFYSYFLRQKKSVNCSDSTTENESKDNEINSS